MKGLVGCLSFSLNEFASMFFIDTLSQLRHSASCMTKFFLVPAITRPDIRPQERWAASLVMQMTTLIFLMGLYMG